MRQVNRIFLKLVVAILLSSCARQIEQPDAIAGSIEIVYVTSSEMTVGDQMEVSLQNKTKYCIQFPLVDGLNIYAEQDGKWVESRNLVTILGDQNWVLRPKDELLSERSVYIQPDIAHLEIHAPTRFYALLQGYLCDDESVKVQKEIPFTMIP